MTFENNNRPERVLCLRPFYNWEFGGTQGDVYCCCTSYIKSRSGNVQYQNFDEIWNGPHYQKVRECMYSGNWEEVCNDLCPHICNYKKTGFMIPVKDLQNLHHITPELAGEISSGNTILKSKPTVFAFSNSGICNIDCLMCGWKNVKENLDLLRRSHELIKPLLPNARELLLTSGGDPFARPDSREILLGEACPDMKIRLITNGQLLAQYWDMIKHHNFSEISISIDAATEETYKIIRRKGKWGNILSALEILSDNRHKTPLAQICMVVMKENFREIPEFIEMAKAYKVKANLSKVMTMGDLPPSSNFFENDKELFQEFIAILRTIPPSDLNETVKLGNLAEYY